MDDEVLASMGVTGGLIGQLSNSVDIDREMELMREADQHSVGESNYEFPRRIQQEVSGLTEVDSVFLSTIEAAVDELAEEDEGRYDAQQTLEWLEEREGETIFSMGL
jgi:hypothetical protein